MVQAGDQAAQALDVQCRPTADVLFLTPAQHFCKVATVGCQRMGRHLALTAQVLAVRVQLPLHHQRTERSEPVNRGSSRPVTSAM